VLSALGNSLIVGGCFSAGGGFSDIGRAKEAVDEIVGFACEEETKAGGTIDFFNGGGRRAGIVGVVVPDNDFFSCILGSLPRGEASIDSACGCCDLAHKEATAVTCPPLPPRADR